MLRYHHPLPQVVYAPHQSAVSSNSSQSINLNSQVLRGLAILSIILHNYTHWMHGAIFENEFMYQSWHVSKLLDYLSHPDGRLPLQFFSFFGHYGVVIFVFLSAYGLEKKYGRTTKEVRPPPLHLDALPQAPLNVYRGVCGIPPTECSL